MFAMSVYSQLGYSILWPLADQLRYDFVVEKDGQFKKVQVKTASWRDTGRGKKYLQARSNSRSNSAPDYAVGDFDEFAFTDGERVWIFPFDVLKNVTAVTLDGGSYRKDKYQPEDYLVKLGD
jgi:hypothetical protein